MWKSRPYDPAFAERAVQFGGQGATRTAIADGLGASLLDLDVWARDHDDFAVALADADTQARLQWERQATEPLTTGKPFRFAAWAKVFLTLFGRAPLAPTQPPARSRAQAARDDNVRVRFEIPDNGRRRRPGRGGEGA